MPILKRRLDICGRQRTWEYVIEVAGYRYQVEAHQVGLGEPCFSCSCGACLSESLAGDLASCPPCPHIIEALRDLNMARLTPLLKSS